MFYLHFGLIIKNGDLEFKPHDSDKNYRLIYIYEIPDKLKKKCSYTKVKAVDMVAYSFCILITRDCVTYMSYFPEELDMFIFPACFEAFGLANLTAQGLVYLAMYMTLHL